jgi:hypothetical protein
MTKHIEQQPESVFSLFAKSRDIVSNNLKIFIIVIGVPILASLIINIYGLRVNPDNPLDIQVADNRMAAVIAVLAVVSFVFSIMTVGLTLVAAKGKTTSLAKLWEFAQKNALRLLGLWIVVGLVILLGLLFFIVPGLIFIRRYYMAQYILVDQNTGIIEAMKKSAELTKPYAISIWTIIGVGLLINVPSVFPLIGPAISTALVIAYSAVPALRYYELKKLQQNK